MATDLHTELLSTCLLAAAYTLVSGDTCSGIAGQNGLTLDLLISANPGIECDNLQIGSTINLRSRTPTTPTSGSSETRSSGDCVLPYLFFDWLAAASQPLLLSAGTCVSLIDMPRPTNWQSMSALIVAKACTLNKQGHLELLTTGH